MGKMRAVQVAQGGGALELVEREMPEPTQGEVRIRVEACGVCHSDSLTVEGQCMLAFVVVAMFVAGLMVGRTPEYLGKKLEAREVKMTVLALLSYSLSILGWTALAAATPAGIAGIANSGPHGFSEILYAYASTTGANGSSFAGLSTNTVFYNLTLAAAMLMGRFVYAIPLLAVAGSLAQKKRLAPSAGSIPTHSLQFAGLLVGVLLIIGGLTYFPAMSLGPVTEQVAMNRGIHYPAP